MATARRDWPLVLVDENVGRSAQRFLESMGVRTQRTVERMHEGAVDRDLLKAAHALEAAVLTHDKDFRGLWRDRSPYPNVKGLIVLRTKAMLPERRIEDAFSILDGEFGRGTGIPPWVEIRDYAILVNR